MESWTIDFTELARQQLRKLDKGVVQRVLKYLRKTVLAAPHPRSVGKALSGNYVGYWRYRVGKYRVICDIQDGILLVVVVTVGNRDIVYKLPPPPKSEMETQE